MVDTTSARAITTQPLRRVPYTEIIRLLTIEATRRVNLTPKPPAVKSDKVVITRQARALFNKWQTLRKRQSVIASQLKFLGYTVPSYSPWDQLHYSDALRHSRAAKWDAAQANRIAKISDLKASALIALVGMANDEAKRYLTTLQQTLAKV